MSDLCALLTHSPTPPFIYLHHPHHPPSLLAPFWTSLPPTAVLATLDAIEHHTPRLFLSAILAQVSAAVSGGEESEGEVSNWVDFSRALREVWARRKEKGKGKEKGKTRVADHVKDQGGRNRVENQEDGGDWEEAVVAVYVTKAERLRTVFGHRWAATTRLSELVGIPITVVLASQIPWDQLRPTRCDALEPIHIYVPSLTRESIFHQLLPGSSHPLYPRFLDLLLSSAGQIVPASPPIEIDYLATALWPIYTAHLPPHKEMILLGREYPDPENPPAPLEVGVKLLTDLKHQLSLALAAAIEDVLPRTFGRAELTAAFVPIVHLGGAGNTNTNGIGSSGSGKNDSLADKLLARQVKTIPKPPTLDLSIAAKFLIVAAYCASYNPVKSDLRLFGRGTGPDGRRRRGGGTRRAGYGRVRMGKIPQRLLGPKPFTLDRLLAVFASIYAEHAIRPIDLEPGFQDEDDGFEHENDIYLTSVMAQQVKAERRRLRDIEREEKWEDEVEHLTMSVKLWSMILDLENQGLLRRMSPVDRLDNVMMRCEVDYEVAKTFAKDLRFTLDEYLYEATL